MTTASIVQAITGVMAGRNYPFEIVVVDDDSPDGTAEVVSPHAMHFPVRVQL